MEIFGIRIEYLPNPSTIQIEGRISVFEILSLLGFVIAIASIIIAVKSMRDQARTRRAEFAFRVWEAFMTDEVQSAFLEIEWGNFHYPYPTQNGFESKEQERSIDRLLYLLDEVAILVETKVISTYDRDRWSYQATRVFRDAGVRAYMKFLDDFFAANGRTIRPHDASRRIFDGNQQARSGL